MNSSHTLPKPKGIKTKQLNERMELICRKRCKKLSSTKQGYISWLCIIMFNSFVYSLLFTYKVKFLGRTLKSAFPFFFSICFEHFPSQKRMIWSCPFRSNFFVWFVDIFWSSTQFLEPLMHDGDFPELRCTLTIKKLRLRVIACTNVFHFFASDNLGWHKEAEMQGKSSTRDKR